MYADKGPSDPAHLWQDNGPLTHCQAPPKVGRDCSIQTTLAAVLLTYPCLHLLDLHASKPVSVTSVTRSTAPDSGHAGTQHRPEEENC